MISRLTTPHSADWVAAQYEFEAVCRRLSTLDARTQSQPIAYFVRPSDRFLPVQVLRMNVGEVGELSFDKLSRIPGVGVVKIRNLMQLLERILGESGGEPRDPPSDERRSPAANVESLQPSCGDVSEVEWRQWCSRIALHALEGERLGRLVARLRDLPRGLWDAPLGYYSALTIAEIRNLPTHGTQKTELILETVRKLNELLVATEAYPGATMVIGPEGIAAADAWLVDVVIGSAPAAPVDFTKEVLVRMLEQIRHDLGETAYGVVVERMSSALPGIVPTLRRGERVSWRERLSNSRLHQIRQDAAAVIRVRWPRAEKLCAAFVDRASAVSSQDEIDALVQALDTLFPRSKLNRSSASPRLDSGRASTSQSMRRPATAAGLY